MSDTPEVKEDKEVEPMLSIFKSRLPNICYVFRDGSRAVFARRTSENVGQYLTDIPANIKELQEVCKGHPHLYIDPAEAEVSHKLADPQRAAEQAIRDDERARVIAELGDANQQRAGLSGSDANEVAGIGAKDFGTSGIKAALAGIGNSTTSASTSAESNAK